MIQNTCKTCRQWAVMLGQTFLGICAVSKRCIDRTETCSDFVARDGENVVNRGRIDGYLE